MWKASKPVVSDAGRYVDVFLYVKQGQETWEFHAFLDTETNEIAECPPEYAETDDHCLAPSDLPIPQEVAQLFHQHRDSCLSLLEPHRRIILNLDELGEDWEQGWACLAVPMLSASCSPSVIHF